MEPGRAAYGLPTTTGMAADHSLVLLIVGSALPVLSIITNQGVIAKAGWLRDSLDAARSLYRRATTSLSA